MSTTARSTLTDDSASGDGSGSGADSTVGPTDATTADDGASGDGSGTIEPSTSTTASATEAPASLVRGASLVRNVSATDTAAVFFEAIVAFLRELGINAELVRSTVAEASTSSTMTTATSAETPSRRRRAIVEARHRREECAEEDTDAVYLVKVPPTREMETIDALNSLDSQAFNDQLTAISPAYGACAEVVPQLAEGVMSTTMSTSSTTTTTTTTTTAATPGECIDATA